MSGYQNDTFNPSVGSGMSQGGGFVSPSKGADPSGGPKKPTAPPVRPVTIRMPMTAESTHLDGGFKIDGEKLESVRGGAVARERGGEMETRCQVDNQEANMPEDEEVVDGGYVRVIGKLKEFSGKRSLHGSTLRLVVDHHEIYAHTLDVIATYLLYANRAVPDTPVADAICEFLRNHPRHNSGGADIKAIVHGIKHSAEATPAGISDALDGLIAEGVVYKTLSDTTYDVTDG
ncbi:hypothetical protein AURDEDRAFT_137173 [Auricularia subglabra TFB-10046 SS5]|nr:hypothetical protein AURDEDRAFT_137173 [Auricularia subglabra TFB-10046 SS5]